MNITKIRHENINLLVNKLGSRSTLAKALGYNDTVYINQLCGGHGSFGNRTARKIEKALSLQEAWMDERHVIDPRDRIGAENIGDRVSQRREKLGLTQAELAKSVGVTQQNIQQLEAGKVYHPRYFHSLVKRLQTTYEWLSTGQQTSEIQNASVAIQPVLFWETPDDLLEGEFVLIDFLEYEAAAGLGFCNVDFPETKKQLAFRTDTIKNSKATSNKLKVFKVEGSSMEPILMPDDKILVDLAQNKVVNGKVFVLVRNKECIVKRLFKRNDVLIISSDNKDDPQFRYDEEVRNDSTNEIKIIGRVVDRSGSSGL